MFPVKHFRILLPLLILALVLSGCGGESQPYEYTQGGKTVTVDPVNHTVTHGADVYTYTMEKRGSITSYVIDYPNGGIYHWSATKHGGAGGGNEAYDEIAYLSGGFLVNAIESSIPPEKTGFAAAGILLMVLGGVNFFFPELPFYLKYGWAVENAEPSDAYITMAKFGGILAAVAGLVWCFI
jgi:hypothetical protein